MTKIGIISIIIDNWWKYCQNITNLVKPKLPMQKVIVPKPSGPEATVSNTSGAEVLSLPSDYYIMLGKEEWDELFGNSRVEQSNKARVLKANDEDLETKRII